MLTQKKKKTKEVPNENLLVRLSLLLTTNMGSGLYN